MAPDCFPARVGNRTPRRWRTGYDDSSHHRRFVKPAINMSLNKFREIFGRKLRSFNSAGHSNIVPFITFLPLVMNELVADRIYQAGAIIFVFGYTPSAEDMDQNKFGSNMGVCEKRSLIIPSARSRNAV